ncbi:hypothetical protein AB7W30_16630 [Providencia manganoxydans]|uniref:hypothetical protein n=1 Tax=Providencia manganoxydans TaxID=2923283 RepID=UPI0032DA7B45
MSDFLHESVAFERISVIAKLGSLEVCNPYERQVVLTLITEIADTARDEIRNKSHKKIRLLESSHVEDIKQSSGSGF